ncbi:unnamed protein product [Lupinus luteus]|uniref:Uncharacterized protein n=1 Tax=Lupinus luteus TaxID=3873 RepID=A0AAV1Y861_LUPLU
MEHIGPSPIIPSLLTLQDEHVSNNIWIGGEVTFRASTTYGSLKERNGQERCLLEK